MDRMLYLAMTGAKNALQAQQTNSHNLANSNTPGFRADFDAMMQQNVSGPGYADRVYSLDVGLGSDFQPGAMATTGRDLDIAVNGKGWIAVQAKDGGEAYTRRGDLTIDETGLLQLGDGTPVLGNGGPIVIPPAQKVEIGTDGTISIVPLGAAPNALAVLDRIKLVNPDETQLSKNSDGEIRLPEGAQADADGATRLATGVLEGSNVNSVDAMVRMIDYARQYETQIKMMTVAKENDESTNTLLRSGGS